jgi:hypothetical protein
LIAQGRKEEKSVPMDGLAREVGASEKELPKNAKLKRLRNKILATDE